MSTPQKVNVLYKYVDDVHFFVSNDKVTIGLCVAHADLSIAYRDVATALSFLFKENHGEDVQFVPSLSFEVFERWLDSMSRAAMQGPTPGVAGQTPWAVAEAA